MDSQKFIEMDVYSGKNPFEGVKNLSFPPNPKGWTWKGYTAMYVSAMATGGLLGVSLVATGHAVKAVYGLVTSNPTQCASDEESELYNIL